MKDIGIFSNYEKRLSLLYAQVNDKFPDSSHSYLKRHCPTKWIKNYNAVFVINEFFQAEFFKEFSRVFSVFLLVLLINCLNQEMEKFL